MFTLLPSLVTTIPFKPPPPLVVNVRRVKQLLTRMVCMTFGGQKLARLQFVGPASHLRVFLPDSKTGKPALPIERPSENAFPHDKGLPLSRTYTPRRWKPNQIELDIEVALHVEGRDSGWASSIKEGNVAVINGRSGGPISPTTPQTGTSSPETKLLYPLLVFRLRLYRLRCKPTRSSKCGMREKLTLESSAEKSTYWLHR